MIPALDEISRYPDGRNAEREIRIMAVDEHAYSVDAPLAGMYLAFDGTLVTLYRGMEAWCDSR